MSKRLPWFRVWDDLDDDPKIRLIATVTGQKTATIKGVYLQMLLHANSFDDDRRGTLAGWNDLLASVKTGLSVDELSVIRNGMQGLLLNGEQITGWHERQRGKLKEDRTNAQRQARYRSRHKNDNKDKGDSQSDNSNAVTEGSNAVTSVTGNGNNDVTDSVTSDPEKTGSSNDSNAPRNAPVTPEVTPYKEGRDKSKDLKPSDNSNELSGDGEKTAAPEGDAPPPDLAKQQNPKNSAAKAKTPPAQQTLLPADEKPPTQASDQRKATSRAKAEPKPRPTLTKVELPAYLDAKGFERYLIVRQMHRRFVDKDTQEALLIQIEELRRRYDVNKLVTMAANANWGNIHADNSALLPSATGFHPARPVQTFDEHGFGETGQQAMAAGIEYARRMGLPIPGQANDPNTVDA